MNNYIATIHKDLHSDYGVQFYDFPGCISVGSTLEEAQIMATEALTNHIQLMLEDGDFIPSPSCLEVIIQDENHQDAIAFFIIKININKIINNLSLELVS